MSERQCEASHNLSTHIDVYELDKQYKPYMLIHVQQN